MSVDITSPLLPSAPRRSYSTSSRCRTLPEPADRWCPKWWHLFGHICQRCWIWIPQKTQPRFTKDSSFTKVMKRARKHVEDPWLFHLLAMALFIYYLCVIDLFIIYRISKSKDHLSVDHFRSKLSNFQKNKSSKITLLIPFCQLTMFSNPNLISICCGTRTVVAYATVQAWNWDQWVIITALVIFNGWLMCQLLLGTI